MQHARLFALSMAGVIIAASAAADAHELPWPRGASHQVGFGHCAKGPCTKRASFAPSVPHRHVGGGWCIGKGAAGYSFGRRFRC